MSVTFMALYRIVPKSADIEKSEYFDKQAVEDTVKETIEHFAVAQIAVSYEYVTAVYTLTYDKDMKLAGIYVR